MKKRYLAIAIAFMVAAGSALQPVTVMATTGDPEMDEFLTSLGELNAGGFYVKESSYVDTENNAFFVTDTMQDAAQVIDAYDLDEGMCVISEEIEDRVIIQTDLTAGQTQELEMDARVSQVESNYMVYGCSDEIGSIISDEMTQWYLDAMNVDRNAQGIPEKR